MIHVGIDLRVLCIVNHAGLIPTLCNSVRGTQCVEEGNGIIRVSLYVRM